MSAQSRALSYAVRPAVVFRYLAQLGLILAAFCLVPLTISLFLGLFGTCGRYGLLILGLLVLGYLGSKIPAPDTIQRNESYAIIAFMFLLTPLAAAFPLSSSGIPYFDAFCLAVSASTTTGLSFAQGAVPDMLSYSLAWMQWYGGLGILVFSLALFIYPGRRAKDLAAVEMEKTDLRVGTRTFARFILFYYCLLSLAAFLSLWISGIGAERAAVYAMGGVSTGGGTPPNIGATPLTIVQQGLLALFCLLGAMPFTYLVRMIKRRHSQVLEWPEVLAILLSCLLFAAALTACLVNYDGMELAEALSKGPLTALFVQTTSGYSALDVSALSAQSKAIFIPFMAVGGGIGSTAGGIKALRLLIGLALLLYFVRRTSMTEHARFEPSVFGRKVDDVFVRDALLLVFFYTLTVIASWAVFLLHGMPPLDSLGLVVSAASNAGYSAGIDTTVLPVSLKLVLVLDMLFGRLELMALLVALYPGTWIGGRRAVY